MSAAGEEVAVDLVRVNLSLPCMARVDANGSTEPPLEERPELCATDAFWMVGKGLLCTQHLRELIAIMEGGVDPDLDARILERASERELAPWAERHRYMGSVTP